MRKIFHFILFCLFLITFHSGKAQTVLGNITATSAGCKFTISQCAGDTILLEPQSLASYTNHKWYSESIGASTEITAAAISSGSYNVLTSSTLPNIRIRIPTSGTTTTLRFILTADRNYTTGACAAKNDTIDINILPLPVANAGTDKTICEGASVQIGTAAVSGSTYAWSPSTGLSSTTIATPTANPLTTTTYMVTVTNSSGCIATDAVIVTVNPKPTKPADVTRSNACPSSSTVSFADLITTGFEMYTNSSRTGSPLTTSQVSAISTNVTYYLFAKSGTCYSDPAQIKSNIVACNCTNNATANAGANKTFCPGTQVTLSDASIGGSATQGQWSIVSGTGSLSSTAMTSTPNTVKFTPTSTTTTVTLRLTTNDPDGNDPITGPCTPASDEVTLTFTPTSAGADRIVCSPASTVSLSGTPTGGTWAQVSTNPAGSAIDATTGAVTGLSGANVYLFYYANNGCTDTVKVSRGGPQINASTDKTICEGSSVTLNAAVTTTNPGVTPITYVWTPSSSLSAANILQPIATPTATTTYSVTATDAIGCTRTDAVIVNINARPTVNAGTDTIRCAGDLGVNIGEVAQAGHTYVWAPAATLSASNISNPIATPNATTTYTVTITNTATTCRATDQVTVTFSALPAATAAATSPTCVGSTTAVNSDGRITLSSFMATDKYQYSIGNTFNPATATPSIPTTVPAGGVIVSNLPNPSGASQQYTVRIYNAAGCYRDRVVTLTKKVCTCTSPILTAVADQTICAGSSFATVSTSVTNGISVTYQWYNDNGTGTGNNNTNAISGQTTATLTALPTAAGTYKYRVEAVSTVDGACSASETVTLVVSPTPATPVVANKTICCASTVDLTSFNPTTAGVTYEWRMADGTTVIGTPTSFPVTCGAASDVLIYAKQGNCISAGDPVKVTVQPAPTCIPLKISKL
jgi:hypothetical protein